MYDCQCFFDVNVFGDIFQLFVIMGFFGFVGFDVGQVFFQVGDIFQDYLIYDVIKFIGLFLMFFVYFVVGFQFNWVGRFFVLLFYVFGISQDFLESCIFFNLFFIVVVQFVDVIYLQYILIVFYRVDFCLFYGIFLVVFIGFDVEEIVWQDDVWCYVFELGGIVIDVVEFLSGQFDFVQWF